MKHRGFDEGRCELNVEVVGRRFLQGSVPGLHGWKIVMGLFAVLGGRLKLVWNVVEP